MKLRRALSVAVGLRLVAAGGGRGEPTRFGDVAVAAARLLGVDWSRGVPGGQEPAG